MITDINIEIVYATAEHQHLWQSRVPAGTCVRQALLQSDLPQRFPLTDFHTAPIGIFGKKVKDNYMLCDWDRIEVYRPLLIDPKENRRRRALQKD
ncbi:RnfH family protein [Snodgrassella communis]|uniref:RnfH family protein n=1 Tax=Snodgrassella communis TaxID=2946699 RepID=UPI001EF3F0AC|nr:RnfH family protein [Snodgrassella communis]